jgi:hypothetical protein
MVLIGVVVLTVALATGIHTLLGGAAKPAAHRQDTASVADGTAPRTFASGTPNAQVSHQADHASKQRTAGPGAAATPSPRPMHKYCHGLPRNTPGGPDPWGGCWPGPRNTGPWPGTKFTPYRGPVVVRTNNTVISGKVITNEGIVVEASGVVIKDSLVEGTTIQNDGGRPLLIEDTKIIGGNQFNFSSVFGSNVTVLRDDLSGGGHEVSCGGPCVVKDSWLHNNFNGTAGGAHQNGFFNDGGSGFLIEHNTVYCVGGCTADVSFIPDGNISRAVVNKNFLMATSYAGYCLDPSSDPPRKPGIVNQMTITNNIFGRGPKGKCAVYGPVSAWDQPNNKPGTNGYHNVWSGNRWVDGKPVHA